MSEIRFPVMITRPESLGSSTVSAHDLQELQKVMMNELKISYGYAYMCDASEIVGTLRRRGYYFKSVSYANLND